MQNTMEQKAIVNYKDLIVWRKSMDFSIEVYKLTAKFPKFELYALASQLRRAAVSIASNIAEGHTRKHTGEFTQFLYVALSSTSEIETQLMIAEKLMYFDVKEHSILDGKLQEIRKMLNGLINSLKRRASA